MSARTTRTRLFAATTVALAALALTACQGGSDTGAEDPSSSATATVTSKPSAGASTGAGPDAGDSAGAQGQGGSNASTGSGSSSGSSGSGSGNASGSNGGSGGNGSQAGDKDDDTKPGKCSASSVKITATNVPRPINHLLLTATNTGSRTCYLPAYPMARFGEAQSVPPVAEETKPQAVTTLEPGKSGYAGVLLSAADGSAGDGYTANTLTVPFDDGSVATVALPSGGVHVDDALTVTYWQPSMDTALTY
ncbi:hypothetical protein GCM10010377_78940 [Streptomyces viridiviolaceus]|uniref:DUF4232 domain-containing protein n=1 Tax=Streptomyces viridiviolaceus TaxID=68282 RepID=A0ABW2DY02_9ACTN|nr:DUF4232 domain-containing protein [Streptomyces viridiviolaceus]GHB76786.1 hypothetical protein GCM10010377_78940 [Streptomyces viridiviolaceus]